MLLRSLVRRMLNESDHKHLLDLRGIWEKSAAEMGWYSLFDDIYFLPRRAKALPLPLPVIGQHIDIDNMTLGPEPWQTDLLDELQGHYAVVAFGPNATTKIMRLKEFFKARFDNNYLCVDSLTSSDLLHLPSNKHLMINYSRFLDNFNIKDWSAAEDALAKHFAQHKVKLMLCCYGSPHELTHGSLFTAKHVLVHAPNGTAIPRKFLYCSNYNSHKYCHQLELRQLTLNLIGTEYMEKDILNTMAVGGLLIIQADDINTVFCPQERIIRMIANPEPRDTFTVKASPRLIEFCRQTLTRRY